MELRDAEEGRLYWKSFTDVEKVVYMQREDGKFYLKVSFWGIISYFGIRLELWCPRLLWDLFLNLNDIGTVVEENGRADNGKTDTDT